MTISLLRLTNFRNITELELAPADGLNLIYGENGSGKSSLLEAIYYLSYGKSFRSNSASHVIKHNATQFAIFAQLIKANDLACAVGIERAMQGSMRLRMNENEAQSFAELANLLPIRLINSHSHQLFESGPQVRRKFLNWGLFYTNPLFLAAWRNFERALKQRNALLVHKRRGEDLHVWTQQLAEHGLSLDQYRQTYVDTLLPYFQATINTLLPFENFSLSYSSGWDKHYSYAEILDRNTTEDLQLGYTQYGPQRADFMIKTDHSLAKHTLSRGQQKLLICAMILAQGLMLMEIANKRLIYLVDDLPAELDQQSRERLMSLLIKQETQVFITAIDCDFFNGLLGMDEIAAKVFHVEQGRVSPIQNGMVHAKETVGINKSCRTDPENRRRM